jgi:hypothetical protein
MSQDVPSHLQPRSDCSIELSLMGQGVRVRSLHSIDREPLATPQDAPYQSESPTNRREPPATPQSAPPPFPKHIPRAPSATSRGNQAPSPPRSDREDPPTIGQSNVERKHERRRNYEDICGTRADPRSSNQASRRASDQIPQATGHGLSVTDRAPQATDRAPQATNRIPQTTVQEAPIANQESPATDQVPPVTDRAVPAPSSQHPSPPRKQRPRRKKRPVTDHGPWCFGRKYKCPWFHFYCGTKCSPRSQGQTNWRANVGDRRGAGDRQQNGEQHRDEGWVDCSCDGSSPRRGRSRRRSRSDGPQPIHVKVGNFEGSFAPYWSPS